MLKGSAVGVITAARVALTRLAYLQFLERR
jgi:hypothetical protein